MKLKQILREVLSFSYNFKPDKTDGEPYYTFIADNNIEYIVMIDEKEFKNDNQKWEWAWNVNFRPKTRHDIGFHHTTNKDEMTNAMKVYNTVLNVVIHFNKKFNNENRKYILSPSTDQRANVYGLLLRRYSSYIDMYNKDGNKYIVQFK